MSNPKDPAIVVTLEQQAIADSADGYAGAASHGDITVHYYPDCQRFSWFDDRGHITKQHAVERLTLTGSS